MSHTEQVCILDKHNLMFIEKTQTRLDSSRITLIIAHSIKWQSSIF